MRLYIPMDDYKDPRDASRDRAAPGNPAQKHSVLKEGYTRSEFSYNYHRVQANKRGREF